MKMESDWQSQKVTYTIISGDSFVMDYDILWKFFVLKDSSLITVVKLVGSTNTSTNFSEYCQKIEGFAERTSYLVLDFRQVDYIDFMVSHKIVTLHGHLVKKKGNLLISGVSDQLTDIFEMFGILEQVPIYEDYKDAIKKIDIYENFTF